jgi:hypothetical protein
MQIRRGFYGDFHVYDEMPFSTKDATKAVFKIARDYQVNTYSWPFTIDYDQKTGYWELWFTPPVSDEDYTARVGLADD